MTHTGIQIIDRTTVPELAELVAQAAAIQQSLNNADGHLNPLGLADGALAFDIAPASVDAGTTHFEQIYQRATQALENTIAAFNQAKTPPNCCGSRATASPPAARPLPGRSRRIRTN